MYPRATKYKRYRPIRRRKSRGVQTHLKKVLKAVHPDSNIQADALEQLNAFILGLGGTIAAKSREFCAITKHKTMNSRHVMFATRSRLTGELAKHAVSELTKAVTKATMGGSGRLSAQAGLQFPTGAMRKLLLTTGRGRVGKMAAVCLAAVLEYISAEILELAGNAARDNKVKKISARHLELAVANDEELSKLFQRLHARWFGVGVVPFIHRALQPKRRTGRRGGAKALRRIRKQQKEVKRNIGKGAFKRLVAEIAQDYRCDTRFRGDAITALQITVEDLLVDNLKRANLLALHARRVTVQPKDLQLAINLGMPAVSNFTLHPTTGGARTKLTAMKGGAQRVRKVLRDNIQGITKPAIQRIAARAGVSRLSGLIYDEVRAFTKKLLEATISSSMTAMELCRRKTLMLSDVKFGINDSLGLNMAFPDANLDKFGRRRR